MSKISETTICGYYFAKKSGWNDRGIKVTDFANM